MDNEPTDKGVKLARACMNGDLKTVKYLVEEGIRADIKYRGWKYPLMLAVNEAHLDVIQFLISPEGGNYDIDTPVNIKGETMLAAACDRSKIDIVEFLLQQGADMITEKNKFSPFEHITPRHKNSIGIAKLFLKYGLSLNRSPKLKI